MLNKDEALEKFRIYKNEIELKLDVHVQRLRMDKGGEYIRDIFNQMLSLCNHRVIHHNLMALQKGRISSRND